MKKSLCMVFMLVTAITFSVTAHAVTEKTLQYDDYYSTGSSVRIISQVPTVGTSVLELSDDGVHATGLGTAVIESGKDTINIKVEKAAVHIALMMGQSNSGNNCGNIEEAIACKKGTAYYWDSVTKTKPDEMIKQKHYRSSFASEWYKQSCLDGSPEKVAIVHVNGITYKDGVSITSDEPYDTKFGWINKDESGFYLSTAGEKSLAAYLNCYDYFNLSPFYDVSASGVYWFQGEHDHDVDRLAPDGRKYIDYYKNLWKLLSSGSDGKLQFFTAFRVKGSGYPANYTLSFCDSLNAQYQAADETEDMYIASNITEEWYSEKGIVDIDTSKYLTAQDDKLSIEFEKLYGYNKAHYYQQGYNILGMDAAYNMYRTLKGKNDEADSAVILQKSGKAETRIECKAGNTVNISLNQMADFCVNLKPGCKKGTTLKLSVISGGKDITDKVLNYNGIIDINKLIDYAVFKETSLIAAFFRNGVKTGESVFKTKAVPIKNYYHWDFTDKAAYSINEKGGLTVASASDGDFAWMYNSKADGAVFTENGLAVTQTSINDQFLLNKGISTTTENGYVIEFTLKLNATAHGALVFGGPNGSGKIIWGYFTSGKISRLVLGNAGSMYFDSDKEKIDFKDYATYRFFCAPDGKCQLTVTQCDFSRTYEAIIQSGSVPQIEIEQFLPYLSTSYFFDGTVKDFKVWTSYESFLCTGARETAKSVIDTEAGANQSETMKKIVSDIKISIDNAKSTDEIENIKQAGIERINAQKEAEKPTEPPKPTEPTKPAEPAKTCSKCGGTHADNFFGNIVCFFNRIGNWFRNLFK